MWTANNVENIRRPVAIDLFAGAGGFSLGFEQAGFDIAAAVDINPIHCAVHKYNFPRTTVIAQPIENVSGQQIVKASGIGNHEVDCVLGGAPCQGFSLIGHRILDDPRNALIRDFLRIVTELKARTFVFENVKGLTVGKHRVFLDKFVEEFDRAGYVVRSPWRVLNAGHFAIPQQRERLILLGAKKEEDLPDYPVTSTNIAGRKSRFDGLPEGPTCADALQDLPDADRFRTLINSDAVPTGAFGEPSAYAAELRCLTDNAWQWGYEREWNPGILTSSARTEHTHISRRRFRSTTPGTVEPISRFFRLHSEGVSNTLRAGTDGDRGAFTSPRPIHYRFGRCITVREMARLHGFPDWFRFHVTKWHGARQIGNAVPPPLARAIAEKIIEALGVRQKSPKDSTLLGGSELLSFGLCQAAEFFGVEAPPSRRNRKSGVKKRKQIEIERERMIGSQAHA